MSLVSESIDSRVEGQASTLLSMMKDSPSPSLKMVIVSEEHSLVPSPTLERRVWLPVYSKLG